MQRPTQLLRVLALAVFSASPIVAQTYSVCNPLTRSDCPPNSALGRQVDISFQDGASDSFIAQGNPTYGADGVSFTVAQSGDSPLLASRWYIMFGKVEVELKAAPGAGIVSSFVMQSDTLDEIDWEWLGADPNQVQSNYFGKGQATTYNRGAFHPDANSQTEFKTYTIDWTLNQIVWQIDGTTVRALSQADAPAGQYPQTPMQIKIGAWAGGDTALNAPGTVEWARGPTDYSAGPFTMQVRSLKVTDYSTGTQYVYNGNSGSWDSITAVGGSINSGASNTVNTNAPAVTQPSGGQPVPFGTTGDSSTYVRPSVFPWVPQATTLATSVAAPTTYPGLPAGWTVSDSGKVLPPSAAPQTPSPPQPTSLSSPSPPSSPSADTYELVSGFDDRGFPTVYSRLTNAPTAKAYDDQGFLITAAPASATGTSLLAQNQRAQADVQTNASASSNALLSMAAASIAALVTSAVLAFVLI